MTRGPSERSRELDGMDGRGLGARPLRRVVPGRLPAWNGHDFDAVLALVVLGALIPLLFAIASGSILIPHNDDWGYRRIALELFHHHHLRLIGWNQMTLVGQILTVQPLLAITRGASWAFGLYGVLAGAIALVATYCLARRFLPTGRAFIAASALAIAPGFLGTEPTFMTDVPSVASTMVCLALGVAAVDRAGRARLWLLGASLLAGLFGFSIREFGLAAPVAVLVTAYFSAPRREVALFSAAFAAGCAAILWWSATLPGPHEPLQSTIKVRTVLAALKLGSDVGIAVLVPALFALVTFRYRHRIAAWTVGVTAALGALGVQLAIGHPFQGNLLTQHGIGGNALLSGDRPEVFVTPLWRVLEFLGTAGEVAVLALLGAWLVSQRPRPTYTRVTRFLGSGTGMLVALIAFYSVGLLLATGAGAFDRYVWPLVGPVAIVALLGATGTPGGTARLWRNAATGVLTAVLWLAAIGLALNSFAYDAARWHAGRALTAIGLPAGSVDAGYEWFGYHQAGPVHMGARPGAVQFAWYEQIYDTPRICGLVLNSTFRYPRLEPAGVTTYRLFAFLGPTESLYRYSFRTSHCPAPA